MRGGCGSNKDDDSSINIVLLIVCHNSDYVCTEKIRKGKFMPFMIPRCRQYNSVIHTICGGLEFNFVFILMFHSVLQQSTNESDAYQTNS